MSTPSKKSFISGQSREIIFNVFQYFKNLKTEVETLKDVKEKTSLATNIAIRSIERVVAEGNTSMTENNGEAKFSSPGKKRRARKPPVTDVPLYNMEIIRRTIYDFHKSEGCRMTVNRLRQKLSDDIDFQGSYTSLRRILKKLGFRWRRTQNNRKVLIEKMDIRALRIKYLQKMRIFRSQNRPIVYLDESYLHSGHTSSKNWTDESTKGLFANISKGSRLIMVHAGGDMGFIPNALLMFKSGMKTGDYHSEMNSENYGKWLEQQLIPNLPAQSVVVIDNAPYHSVQIHPAPTSNSRKAEMINWLNEKNIVFHPDMLKPQLYEIIKRHKKQYIQYKYDQLLEAHGHSVLRLPPYHPDLNPIELIWATVKNNVAQKNVSFKLEDVKVLAEYEFNQIGTEEWKKRCQHVVRLENEYLQQESFLDNQEEIEPIIINLQDEETDTCSDCSDDYYSDIDCIIYYALIKSFLHLQSKNQRNRFSSFRVQQKNQNMCNDVYHIYHLLQIEIRIKLCKSTRHW